MIDWRSRKEELEIEGGATLIDLRALGFQGNRFGPHID